MDNITHSLVGVALADLAAGRTPKSQRPLLVGAAIVAANLPDIDLAYSAITPSPLGYLMHHRGHTHTIAGLGGLAIALVLAYGFFPSVRKLRFSGQLRFWLLIAVALASHLALDALNTYGIHPFYPFDNTWYYGDIVFILEPFFWLTLGIAIAAGARSRMARLSSGLPLLVLLVTIAATRAVPPESVAALVVVGGAFAWLAVRVSPRTRAAVALTLCGLMVAGLAGASRAARLATLDALRPAVTGHVVDVVLTPNPSSPLCWSVIAIEQREIEASYVLWRGTLSLLPEWRSTSTCALHGFFGGRDVRVLGDRRLVLTGEIHQPLARLRALARDDCRARAWLRFGRAPVIDGEWIYDLRFRERSGDNFSRMRLTTSEGCPSHVPEWSMPRADLLR